MNLTTFNNRNSRLMMTVILILLSLTLALTGCTKQQSAIKDAQADILGLKRTVSVYDFFGAKSEYYEGSNVRIDKSDIDNALLITMDGKTMTMVGNTAIIMEQGVTNLMDDPAFMEEFKTLQADLAQPSSGGSGLTFLDKKWNKMISGVTGLKRVLIVKSEGGKIIGVFRGNNVLLEKSDLPNTTKILIDGKRLHLHRTNYTIIEMQ